MAVSQDTLDIIYTIKDLDYEYNIKLFLFFGTLIMMCVSFYFSKRIERTNIIKEFIFYGMSAFQWLVLILSPLYSLILLRSVSLNNVIVPLIVIFYLIFMYISVMGLVIWLGMRGLEKFLGVKFGEKKRLGRESRDYRRIE